MKTNKTRRAGAVLLGVVAVAGVGLAIIGIGRPWAVSEERQSDAASTQFDPSGGSENSTRDEDGVRSLPVSFIELGTLPPPVRSDNYRGILQPSKEAEVGFRRGGRVNEVNVDEGTIVQRGQVLAKLDVHDLDAEIAGVDARTAEAEAVLAELVAGPRVQTIAAAAADVQRLEAAVKLARITTAREAELQRSSASSVQEYDNARYTLDQQTAALESANQTLLELREGSRPERIAAQKAHVAMLAAEREGLETDLRDSRIEAPFAGVVSRRLVDEGTVANPERVILRIIQVNPLEARFGVSPEDARWLTVGQKVKIEVGSQQVTAIVNRIEPELEMVTRTQNVIVEIDRTGMGPETSISDGIVPGRTASLSLEGKSLGDVDQLWVPITSLARSTRGLWSLFVVVPSVGGGYEVERKDVQVVETDTKLARISGGMIKAGDRIVDAGLHRLTPGMKVEPVGRELGGSP